MKKFFTLIASLACLSAASAANFTIQRGADGSKIYADGDVITLGYTVEDWGDGMVEYKWDPELYATGSGKVNFTVTGYEEAQFCGGGMCSKIGMTDNGKVERTMTLTAGTASALQLDLDLWDYGTGSGCPISQSEDVVLTCTQGSTTVTVTVRFIPSDYTSISSVQAGSQKISFSGKTMTYSFDAPTTVAIYSISGQSAITRRLNGRGTLSMQSLPAGVYIYRAGSRTGKFIVR